MVTNLVARYELAKVSKLMGRSEKAVVDRTHMLKVSRRIRDGWFTCTDVAEMFGVSRSWVQDRIHSGAIKATPHYRKRPPELGGAWHIKESDLKDFIRRYPEEMRDKKINMSLLVDILAGIKVYD
jgi:hypothetical protein